MKPTRRPSPRCRRSARRIALRCTSQVPIRAATCSTWKPPHCGTTMDSRRKTAADRERALRDTAAALSSTLDPDLVLNKVLENLSRVLPHDAANILIMGEGGMARPVITRGYREMGVDEDALRKLSFQVGAAE